MNASIRTLALAAAVVFRLGTAQAAGPERAPATITANSAALEHALDRQLNKHVVFPLLDRSHDMTGVVNVSFVVNAAGRIEVLSATSDNEALCEYVVRKLGKVDIGDNPSGTWKTSHVRFVFRPEA
ncbi:MAG: hypothetical protein JST66_08235 [Bacteroidetes bacterium]|nr:hypothetical protein [Bacteroidota bacterium]